MRSSRLALSQCVLLAMASLTMAQKGPAPVDIGTLGGASSQANGIAGKDFITGSSGVSYAARTHAFITDSSGVPRDLGSLIGPPGNSTGAAISSTAVAGTSDFNITEQDGTIDTVSHAFYFPFATRTMGDLGTLGGSTSQAFGTVNGNVVGTSLIAGDVATHAFYWNATAATMMDLNTLPGGTNSQAQAINIGGVAVGSSDTADGSTHAVLWFPKASAIYDIGTLGGSFAQANAINKFALIAGLATTLDDTATHAFVGSVGALFDIGTLGGSYAQANAISDSGVAVGSSNIADDADVHAFVWTAGGGMVDLNNLLPPGSPWNLQSANGIGPDGTIVGVGIINGESHAFSW